MTSTDSYREATPAGDPRISDADTRRPHLLLITDDLVQQGPGGLTAKLASTRLRLLVALDALNRQGFDARLVANTTPEHIAESLEFARADLLLIGKVYTDYRGLLDRAYRDAKAVVLDVTDDLERFPPLAPMRALVGHIDAATVPSDGLEDLVSHWTDGKVPVWRVADPFEGVLRPAGGDLGRRPLRLLWFGSPTGAGHLLSQLPGLIASADRIPMALTLVSTGRDYFGRLLDGFRPTWPDAVRVRFVEWSPEAQDQELERCDIVLLPNSLDGSADQKSANRLIAAIAAGRWCVATPTSAYLPFADHALLTPDLASGIEATLARPAEQLMAAIAEGQRLIARDYAPEVVGRSWVETLSAISRRVLGSSTAPSWRRSRSPGSRRHGNRDARGSGSSARSADAG